MLIIEISVPEKDLVPTSPVVPFKEEGKLIVAPIVVSVPISLLMVYCIPAFNPNPI